MLSAYLNFYNFIKPYSLITIFSLSFYTVLTYIFNQGVYSFAFAPEFGSIFLSSIVFLPLISILVIFLFLKNNIKSIYIFSIWMSMIIFIFSLIGLNFISITDISSSRFFFYLSPLTELKVELGIDTLNIFFIILNNLFTFLCFIFAYNSNIKSIDMLIYLFFLQWGVNSTFFVLDLFGFFIFFESTLIPIFLMILIYGSRERRVRASFLIALYTLFGSIFLFFVILYSLSKFGTTNFYLLKNLELNDLDQQFYWVCFFLGFSTKIPIVPVHIWLPEAHVEAPTIGSVLLAVILLKLGSYGMFRFILELVPFQTYRFNTFFGIFSILSIWFTSLTALRQVDLKKIIAYSSVGHMNVIILGFLFFNAESLEGSLFQMLSHGLVSGSLFFLIGSLYLRLKVRSLEYLGGLMTVFPLLSIYFLIFCMANISFPGTSSFIGEFLIFFGIFKESLVYSLAGSLSMVLGAGFVLWALNRLVFGSLKDNYVNIFYDLNRLEFFMYFFLLVLTFGLGCFPSFILNYFSLYSFRLY